MTDIRASSPVEGEKTARIFISEDGDQFIRDAIRSAYDRGYNDARNAKSVPGDGAAGYRGREMSHEISEDCLARLARLSSAEGRDARKGGA